MKKCERIDLNMHNRAWKALPDMKEGRTGFNPCLFNGYVYMCGNNSQLVEIFCQTDRFLHRLRYLPPETSPCCPYMHKNLLVVHSERHISKFTARKAGQLTLYSQIQSVPMHKWSNSQPIVNLAQGFFYVIYNTHVVSYNMETGVEVQRFT